MKALTRLVGRGRSLEILIGADDFNGELAERYVDALATRIASFDQHAIVETKKLVDAAGMPSDEAMRSGWDAFITSVQRPPARTRVKALVEKGPQQPGDDKKSLGQHTAKYEE